jgi:sugar phosphate isomerase/epimerase
MLMANFPSRREWITGMAGSTALLQASIELQGSQPVTSPKPLFRYCLNTSTIRDKEGTSRPLAELIEIAAKAGYEAIEPWTSEINEYVRQNGSLKELRQRIQDAGLQVANVIGFSEWIVEDPQRRKKGLEQAKRDIDLAAQLGSPRIAAPPVGATGGASKRDDPQFTQPVIDLMAAADRYRSLLDVGKSMGVTPVVEIWGFSKTLRRLGEALLVAVECGDSRGCILPDVYHLYKGGSDFTGLRLVSAKAIGIFHVNDYPKIDRDKITDADRVYPGDGIAPLKDVFTILKQAEYRGFVSLELFNRDYWRQDPLRVAKTGLSKMKSLAIG